MDSPLSVHQGTLDGYFAEEHRRLDKILSDVLFLSKRHSFYQAAKRFGEFRHLLEGHLAIEEQVLLALFVAQTGDPGALVPTILEEHDRIKGLLQPIAAALSQWDLNALTHRLEELTDVLETHHHREGELLHPALDSILKSEADWCRLVNQACFHY